MRRPGHFVTLGGGGGVPRVAMCDGDGASCDMTGGGGASCDGGAPLNSMACSNNSPRRTIPAWRDSES